MDLLIIVGYNFRCEKSTLICLMRSDLHFYDEAGGLGTHSTLSCVPCVEQ
jgi:hypothetical protein